VLIAEESAIRLNEIEGYIKILKPNKPPGIQMVSRLKYIREPLI